MKLPDKGPKVHQMALDCLVPHINPYADKYAHNGYHTPREFDPKVLSLRNLARDVDTSLHIRYGLSSILHVSWSLMVTLRETPSHKSNSNKAEKTLWDVFGRIVL